MLRLRYAQVPVVSAMRGIALGGGCELALYSARRVAHMESYVGLVEVGVGLVPAGGGLTYDRAPRRRDGSRRRPAPTLLAFLKEPFTAAAMAKVGTSAIESRAARLPARQRRDRAAQGRAADGGARAGQGDGRLRLARAAQAARSRWPAATRIATIKAQLVGLRDGGFISEHDFHIASLIADVVCGGDVDAGSLVSEEYLMALERKHFCALLDHPKTQERIMGMLQTGKPVRN